MYKSTLITLLMISVFTGCSKIESAHNGNAEIDLFITDTTAELSCLNISKESRVRCIKKHIIDYIIIENAKGELVAQVHLANKEEAQISLALKPNEQMLHSFDLNKYAKTSFRVVDEDVYRTKEIFLTGVLDECYTNRSFRPSKKFFDYLKSLPKTSKNDPRIKPNPFNEESN